MSLRFLYVTEVCLHQYLDLWSSHEHPCYMYPCEYVS